MGKRTASIQTYLEPDLFVVTEKACIAEDERMSHYVRRLIVKDLIDRKFLSTDDVLALAGA